MKPHPYKVPFLANDMRFAGALMNSNLTEKVQDLCVKFDFHKTIRLKMIESFIPLATELEISIPSWVIGLGIGNEIIILNPEKWNNNISLEQLILHESVHIILSEYCNFSIPVWLNEGLATYYANQDCGIANNNFDPGSLDYSSDNFYANAKALTEKAIAVLGEDNLIKHIKNWDCECEIIERIMDCEK